MDALPNWRHEATADIGEPAPDRDSLKLGLMCLVAKEARRLRSDPHRSARLQVLP